MIRQSISPPRKALVNGAKNRKGFLGDYFYFFMSLIIATVVVYGFSQTAKENLLHPVIARPFVLYVHAAVFSGWVLFFIFQSALVRTGMMQWHRRIGWIGAGLGIAMLVVGVETAITMGRFNIFHSHPRYPEGGLLISFFDITAFTIPFALAIYWRKKPEFHRRLQFMATCALTAAAFGRFPRFFLTIGTNHSPAARGFLIWFALYAGVDLLISMSMLRDLAVNRRIHPAYLFGLPAFVLCQAGVLFTLIHHAAWWLKTARFILG
ncbi:MAG TPA: hypothetical protein VEK33_23000 [Terriglobales bacterium]|nr:hypothetical protein [Terriglobales bacterium]